MEHTPAPLKINFSPQGSEVAGAVVPAVGLDDRVATVSDMDAKAKDVRFGCSICPPFNRNIGAWTKAGYNWRNFVCSTF
jgi:hypothetical protein